jgi:Flp pilus assembly protein TadG
MSDFLRSMMMPKGGGIKSMVGSLRRFGRRFAACRRGTSSVEFVLVLGPMILFLFGIIGFGLITYAHSNMVNAAREATRRLSVIDPVVIADGNTYNCNNATDMSALTALNPTIIRPQQIACEYLTDWTIPFDVTATECVLPVTDPDHLAVTVRIVTNASDAFMVDLWGLFSGDLVAEVTMRREVDCDSL